MRTANEMELLFDSRSENEGFARVAVAAFFTQVNPTSRGCAYSSFRGSNQCHYSWL